METERFMLNDSLIQFESTCFQTFSASGVARVQDWHIVFSAILLIAVNKLVKFFAVSMFFFSMCREEDILTFFQSKTFVNIGCFDLI